MIEEFFEDIDISEYLNSDKILIEISHTQRSDKFLEAGFYLSNRNQIHIRSYIDIIAQEGGILSLFLPFIQFN